jgi:hypothetical protein
MDAVPYTYTSDPKILISSKLLTFIYYDYGIFCMTHEGNTADVPGARGGIDIFRGLYSLPLSWSQGDRERQYFWGD